MVASAEGVTPHKKEGSARLEVLFCLGSGFNVEEEEDISLVRAEGWDLALFSSMMGDRWVTGGWDWLGGVCFGFRLDMFLFVSVGLVCRFR